jgi:hypothetical protein
MSTSVFYSPITGHKRTVHWYSWIARLGGKNNCMTLSASHIFSADGDMNAETQAHEDGHAITAEKRGILYLPWVAWQFVAKGYAKSKAENEGDDYMRANRHLYSGLKAPDDR